MNCNAEPLLGYVIDSWQKPSDGAWEMHFATLRQQTEENTPLLMTNGTNSCHWPRLEMSNSDVPQHIPWSTDKIMKDEID